LDEQKLKHCDHRNYSYGGALKSSADRNGGKIPELESRIQTQEELIHREKDRIGTTARFYTVSCGLYCADCGPHCTPAPGG
jgi:hypothetical protein